MLHVMTTMKRSYKEYQRDVDSTIKQETKGVYVAYSRNMRKSKRPRPFALVMLKCVYVVNKSLAMHARDLPLLCDL